MNKKIKFKKSISVLFITAFLLSIFVPIMAENPIIDPDSINPEQFAVYLNNDLDANNFEIEGHIYSANGDASFGSSGTNKIVGDVYLNAEREYKPFNQWNEPKGTYEIIKLDVTTFDAPDKYFPDIPIIENIVESFTTPEDPIERVTEDTHYNNLEVKYTLQVDVTESDRYIVVDSMIFSSNGYIELVGDHNLFLFINGNLNMAGKQSFRGDDTNSIRTHVFIQGDVNLNNNTEGTVTFANIYAFGDNININSKKMYGNIVSNTATSFQATGSTFEIYGTIYTPKAYMYIKSIILHGRLVADSLDLNGGTIKIIYDENYSTLEMPFEEPSSEDPPIEDEDPPAEEDPPVVDDIPEGPSLLGDLLDFPYAYLYGDGYGSVFADDNIKREEAVAVIYRLLKQNNKLEGFKRGSVEPYTNIDSDRWSTPALEFMKYIEVYKGSSIDSGTSITRGEIAKIVTFALRIKPDDSKTIDFDDLSTGNQYYYYIKALVDKGYLQGWGNNIMPDKEMTRAEFATMVNRMIGRDGRYEVIDELNPYPNDLVKNPEDSWPFNDVFRASFGYSEDTSGGIYKIDPDNKYPIDDLNAY